MGGLPKEKQYGPFVSEFEDFLKAQKSSIVDISSFIQDLYCIKDNKDLVNIFN